MKYDKNSLFSKSIKARIDCRMRTVNSKPTNLGSQVRETIIDCVHREDQ